MLSLPEDWDYSLAGLVANSKESKTLIRNTLNELKENSTTQKIRVVQKEGKRQISRKINFYSLDAIIAVGYRVNSKEATDFRIWATNTLKEYIKR